MQKELLSCQYKRVKPFISTPNESEPSIGSAAPLQLPGAFWKYRSANAINIIIWPSSAGEISELM